MTLATAIKPFIAGCILLLISIPKTILPATMPIGGLQGGYPLRFNGEIGQIIGKRINSGSIVTAPLISGFEYSVKPGVSGIMANGGYGLSCVTWGLRGSLSYLRSWMKTGPMAANHNYYGITLFGNFLFISATLGVFQDFDKTGGMVPCAAIGLGW